MLGFTAGCLLPSFPRAHTSSGLHISPTPAESNSEAGLSLPRHHCLHKAHLVPVIRPPLRPVADIPLWGQSTIPYVPQRGSHSFVLNQSPTEAQQMDFRENKSPDYMINCVHVSVCMRIYVCACLCVHTGMRLHILEEISSTFHQIFRRLCFPSGLYFFKALKSL